MLSELQTTQKKFNLFLKKSLNQYNSKLTSSMIGFRMAIKGKFLNFRSAHRIQLKNFPIDYANKSCSKAINETLSINRV